MIGDVILIKKSDVKRGKDILPDILNLPDKSVIAIGGSSGTKKSEIAQVLQELLYKKNKRTILISLDDLYCTHFKDRTRIRKRKGVKSVGLQEMNWKLLLKIIKTFKHQKDTLILPVINKYSSDYNEETVYGVKDVNYIIIEGLYACHLKKLKKTVYTIHLNGTPEQTLKFRKKRNKERESSDFRKRVVQKEFNVVSQLKRYADKIIPV